jgi:hypothetical protein
VQHAAGIRRRHVAFINGTWHPYASATIASNAAPLPRWKSILSVNGPMEELWIPAVILQGTVSAASIPTSRRAGSSYERTTPRPW